MEKNNHVGERLADLIDKSGVTAYILSDKMGYAAPSGFSRFLKSERPEMSKVKKLCTILGVDFEQEFGDIYEKELRIEKFKLSEPEVEYRTKNQELTEKLNACQEKNIALLERVNVLTLELAKNNIPIPE